MIVQWPFFCLFRCILKFCTILFGLSSQTFWEWPWDQTHLSLQHSFFVLKLDHFKTVAPSELKIECLMLCSDSEDEFHILVVLKIFFFLICPPKWCESSKVYGPAFINWLRHLGWRPGCLAGHRRNEYHSFRALHSSLLCRVLDLLVQTLPRARFDIRNVFFLCFRDFYFDVLPEFEKLGRITQFKVCCNKSPHLKGNVYVQYDRLASAETAVSAFNGRWYAGKQISCIYVPIEKWRPALCGWYFLSKPFPGSSRVVVVVVL